MLTSLAHDDALWAIALIALVLTLADTAFGVLRAVRDKAFSLDYVAEFLTGHVALRTGPIILLALIASVVSALVAATPDALPDTIKTFAPGVWVAAWAGLLAYAGETVASLNATRQGGGLGVETDKP